MSDEFLTDFNQASSIADGMLNPAQKLKGLAVATVVEAGTSLWNSVVPEAYEASTEDILSSIDKDSLRVFEEDPDTIHALSMIGGSFVPGGLGLKLLTRAKAGLTALGWGERSGLVGSTIGSMLGTKQKLLSAEIQAAFKEAGGASLEIKALRRKLLASNIAEQVSDNAVLEAAVVAGMNAHPWMEDYFDDPVSNFLKGAALGGVIGAGFAYPITNRLVREATGAAETSINREIIESGVNLVYPSATRAAQVQGFSRNVEILERLAADKTKDAYFREKVSGILLEEREGAIRAAKEAAPLLDDPNVSKEIKDTVLSLLNDPRFAGIDDFRIFNMDKVGKITAREMRVLDLEPTAIGNINKATSGDRTLPQSVSESLLDEAGKAQTIFVRLGTKETFAFEGGRNAALAADLVNIKSLLEASAISRDVKLATPVRGWSQDLQLGVRDTSAARQNAEFLQELVAHSKLGESKLGHIIVGPDHLPRMNALIALADKLSPEDAAKFRVKITGEFPQYYAQKSFVEKTVRPTYWDDLSRLAMQEDLAASSGRGGRLSDRARSLIQQWIDGGSDQIPLSRAMHASRTNRLGANSRDDLKAADEIWESGAELRALLKESVADADGYLYLWRGMQGSVKGHGAVQSYAFSRRRAASFASEAPVLYKIHSDDVIGSVAGAGEAELLVSARAYEAVENVPMGMATGDAVEVAVTKNVGEGTIGIKDLLPIYADTSQQLIKDMAKQGFSVPEISSRLAITNDGILHVLGGGDLKNATSPWRMYTDAEKIPEYIGMQNKLFAAKGNPSRNPSAARMANLDRKAYRQMHLEMSDAITQSSGSVIGNTLNQMHNTEGMRLEVDRLADVVGKFNNARVGDPRWQSADNALRDIEEGPIATGIGKLFINQMDQLRQQILQPLAQQFVSLRSKPLALVEFNRAVNKLYSMRGWRDFTEDEITGKLMLVEKDDKGLVRYSQDESGEFFTIHQPEVAAALDAIRGPARELFKLHNLNRKLRGQKDINDLGFYVPPLDLVNRFYAFAIDNSGAKTTQLLVANSAEELTSQISAWKRANTSNENMRILTKGNQEADNLVRLYHSGDSMITHADISLQHAGTSSLAILPNDERLLENILGNFNTSFIQGGRAYSEHYMRDITGWLDKMSHIYQEKVRDQPVRAGAKPKARDAAWQVKNILLGQDQLRLAPRLQQANDMTEFLINRGAQAVNNVAKMVSEGEVGTAKYFDEFNKAMAEIGIKEPIYESLQLFQASLNKETRNIAPQLISAGNGMVATMQLRVLESAHAIVNLMSLPILTWSSLMERLPSTPVGPGGAAVKFPLRLMYDAVKHMHSPNGRRIEDLWNKQGSIDLTLRQFDDVTTDLNRVHAGGNAVETAANAMSRLTNNKGIVRLLSKPSDWTEQFTRRFAMHLGYLSAKTAKEGISDAGATLAAMHFADRSIGVYHAAQRPTAFQGTLGATLGLYQTYMLTFAQHIYRGLENRNFKQLAALMLSQAGIFGTKSLPGYNLLSEHVVSHMNQDNWDLTTGTYRAIGDPAAEMVLYGMPSSISGTAFYSRGDISPRIPGTVTDLALVNSAKQGYEFVGNLFSSIAQGVGDGNFARSAAEAISLQSLNRPFARYAELAMGASVSKAGNTISTSNGIYSTTGILARILGARPIEEQVTREAQYLDKFYQARDRSNRHEATTRIDRALRGGSLDDDTLGEVAIEYFRNGGTAQGWKSMMNDALVRSHSGLRLDMLQKMQPGNPLYQIIDELY